MYPEADHLGPFLHTPFTPWCQTSPLMIDPKKESTNRCVILDLSWPHLPQGNINGGIPRDCYLWAPKKMHLHSPSDFVEHIRRAGKWAWLYSTDIARAYRQLPLGPLDWPLICFTEGGGAISLMFVSHLG